VKRLAFLIGPELLWGVFFLLASWLAGRNSPPSPAGNALLERSCWLGAFLATALTFAVFLVPAPGVRGGWLLARVVLATVVGANLCLAKLSSAIDYGDSRNSGTWGFWMYGILACGVALVPGAILTLILLSRAPR
jgi:hypothetical protein